jgi:hypothetical protein
MRLAPQKHVSQKPSVHSVPLKPGLQMPGQATQSSPPVPQALCAVPRLHVEVTEFQQPVQQAPSRHTPDGQASRSAFAPVSVQASVAQLTAPS